MKGFYFFLALLFTIMAGIFLLANMQYSSDFFFFWTVEKGSMGSAFLSFFFFGAIWSFFVSSFVKKIFFK